MDGSLDKPTIYRNLRRPEVDKLFSERDRLINEALDLKKVIVAKPDREKAILGKIDEIIRLAEQKDAEARKLWHSIIEKSKSQ